MPVWAPSPSKTFVVVAPMYNHCILLSVSLCVFEFIVFAQCTRFELRKKLSGGSGQASFMICNDFDDL